MSVRYIRDMDKKRPASQPLFVTDTDTVTVTVTVTVTPCSLVELHL